MHIWSVKAATFTFLFSATRLRQLSTAGEGDVVGSDPEVEPQTNDLYHQMTSPKMAAIPLDQRQSFYT